MKFKIWTVIIMSSIVGFVGCAPKSVPAPEPDLTIEQPAPEANAKISVEAAEKIAAEKKIENAKSIELLDLEGKKIDRTFTETEIKTIVEAYNESYVQDTAYIMMIAGNTMLITLEDDTTVSITSYGDENNIIAATSTGNSYHLGCPVIGKILLEEAK